MDFIRFFLIMIVPGIISAIVYGRIGCVHGEPRITTSLVYDLFILLINLTGLYIFRSIYTISLLIASFNSTSFTIKYGLLSLFVGFVLAFIFGILHKMSFTCKKPS